MGNYERLLENAEYSEDDLQRDLRAFGNNVRKLRMDNNLSTQVVADLLEYSSNSYYKLEAGEVNFKIKNYFKLQKMFARSPIELLPYEPPELTEIDEITNELKGLRKDQIRYIHDHVKSLVKLMK